MITYKELTKAIKKLKHLGVRDELFYAGVCPDGVYRVIPAEELARMMVAQEKQKKEAAQE